MAEEINIEPAETIGIDIDGQVTTVHYSRVFNLGNYENEKIGITANVIPGQAVQDVIAACAVKVAEKHEERQTLQGQIRDIRCRIGELIRDIDNLTRRKSDLIDEIQSIAEANPDAVANLDADSADEEKDDPYPYLDNDESDEDEDYRPELYQAPF